MATPESAFSELSDRDIKLRTSYRKAKRKRPKKNDREVSETGFGDSESEEDVTVVISDSVMDKRPIVSDSLPSYRRFKAQQQSNLQRHNRESAKNSTEPLSTSSSFRYVSGSDTTPLIHSQKSGPREASLGSGEDETRGNFGTFERQALESGAAHPKKEKVIDLSFLPGKCFRGKKMTWKKTKIILNHIKVLVLTGILVAAIAMFASQPEAKNAGIHLAVTADHAEHLNYSEQTSLMTLHLHGPFNDLSKRECHSCNASSNELVVCGQNKLISKCYKVDLVASFDGNYNNYKDNIAIVSLDFDFQGSDSSIDFFTGNGFIVPFTVDVISSIISETAKVIVAALILVGVYILIIFELTHRTLAAIIGSTLALGFLSVIGERPTLQEVILHIEWNTIWLLFGMMVLVAIFSMSGFFDWAAVKMYKLARGRPWPMIILLCTFAGVVSAFLDNVTTILLMTPVSIRLSQVLNLDPRYVLIAEVVFSNIGGTATAIGDPPNVIIVTSPHIQEKGIGFNEFTLHVFLGIVFVFVLSFFFLRFVFWICRIRLITPEPPHVAELKREMAIWQRTAGRMPQVSLEERAVREALQQKARDVEQQLKENFSVYVLPTSELWKSRLPELEAKYIITNRILLVKSIAVLTVVIIFFFVANLVDELHFDIGWIALFGAMTLLILSNIEDLENILEKVEWGTLLFFAGLFVLMELLAELGLINFIADVTVGIIENVDEEQQMTVAILLILWVSALASAFIDNIPFTAAIIPVIVDVAEPNKADPLCVSLKPLVWALALGACLGGNGTLIGASANVVCAGMAEQNGYPISFKTFFKVGFPMMLFTVVIAMIYLLICHSAIKWDVMPCPPNSSNSSSF